MPSDTPDQQITLPIGADAANNPLAFTNFVADVEQRLVRLYASEADRTARRSSVAENEVSALADLNRVDIYDGANDISLYQRSLFAAPRLTGNITLTQNTTVLQSVAGMSVAMPATGTFAFHGPIWYSSSTTADIKFAFTFPAGAAVIWNGMGIVTGSSGTGDATFSTTGSSGISIPFGGSGVGTIVICKIEGTYVGGGTAGTLQFQAAQFAAELSNTVLHSTTRLEIWRQA